MKYQLLLSYVLILAKFIKIMIKLMIYFEILIIEQVKIVILAKIINNNDDKEE